MACAKSLNVIETFLPTSTKASKKSRCKVKKAVRATHLQGHKEMHLSLSNHLANKTMGR